MSDWKMETRWKGSHEWWRSRARERKRNKCHPCSSSVCFFWPDFLLLEQSGSKEAKQEGNWSEIDDECTHTPLVVLTGVNEEVMVWSEERCCPCWYINQDYIIEHGRNVLSWYLQCELLSSAPEVEDNTWRFINNIFCCRLQMLRQGWCLWHRRIWCCCLIHEPSASGSTDAQTKDQWMVEMVWALALLGRTCSW